MRIPFSPLVVLLLAVLAQAVFAAGLLWTAPFNQVPNRFLALLMLAIVGWLLDGFFRVAGLYGQNPGLYFLPIYYSLGFGPLLYFYVRSLLNRDFCWSWRRYGAHFLPVLLQAGLYGWLCAQPYDTRNWFWQTIHRPYTYGLEFIGTWISLLTYLLLSLRRLRHYGRWLANTFSELSELSELRLRWLRWLLVLLAIVSGQWFVEIMLHEFFDLYYKYDYSTELLGVVVFIIGVVGLQQADMRAVRFQDDTEAAPDAGAPAVPEEAGPAELPASAATTFAVPDFAPVAAGRGAPAAIRTGGRPAATSGAAPPAGRPTPAVDPAVLERIRRVLEDEQLYLNPTLTLAELAAHTRLPAKLISFTINAGFGRSFNDVVNGRRVAEMQRRLALPNARRFTLLGIALESGFNSKTTFNRIFKQFTGVAPGHYLMR